MSETLNDAFRWLIGHAAAGWGAWLSAQQRWSLMTYRVRQRHLRQRFAIEPSTPIETYGPATEARIGAWVSRVAGPVKFALTSGSSAQPKRIPYSAERIRNVKRVYVDVFCRMYWSLPIKRRSLFVMAGVGEDDSLTARLLAEGGRVSQLALLQAPYRVQNEPAVKELIVSHGLTAVRLLLLTQANPGILYATNPSTLSTFFDEVTTTWKTSARLVRDFHLRPGAFGPTLVGLVGALASRGARRRLAAVAGSADNETPLPLTTWAPGLEAYMCWTGGYVTPFLERLAFHLPPSRYRRIPMYAMSTETIETVTYFPRGITAEPAFLPLAGQTLYELLPEGKPDTPEYLLAPWEAAAGQNFSLVVSNGYGLRRYQTDDLFHCQRLIGGLPDLRFLRRRALEHSFTGEKVTAEQLTLVFAEARAALPDANAIAFLTCLPSQPPGERVPHYRVVVVPALPSADGGDGHADDPRELDVDALANDVDARLRRINPEYRDKIHSGRLQPMRGVRMNQAALVLLIGGKRHAGNWEAQLKLLPLYPRTWESFSASANA